MRVFQAEFAYDATKDPPEYTESHALQSVSQAYSREAREPTTFSKPREATEDEEQAANETGDAETLAQVSHLPEAERLSDLGDAALLEAQYCRVLKHTPELGWLAYHEGKWDAGDGEKAAHRYVRRVLEGLATQAAGELGTDHGKKLFGHAHQACNRVPYITRAAESFERLSVHQADFDADPFLLGVKNGVVDLRTGQLRAHDPTLLLSHQSPVAYHPDAKAPRWERFLREVFAGDEAQIRFVQKAVGYSFTADTREQVFFLCHGSGANGKGVFLNTLDYVAGDYAAPLNPEEFMARFNRAETQPNLVGIVGRRFITSQEPTDGSAGGQAPPLDAARVKWLTGGDPIQIRTLHSKPFFYQPIWKLWLAMNRLPDIRDDSDGIWRRIRPIPFTVSFRGREDPTLTATLRSEAEGILAWVAEGTRLWLAD